MKKFFTIIIVAALIPLISSAQEIYGCNSNTALVSISYGYGFNSPFNVNLSTSFYNGRTRLIPSLFIMVGSHKDTFSFSGMKIIYGGKISYRCYINKNNILLPGIGIAGRHDKKITSHKEYPYKTTRINELLPVIDFSFNHLISKDNLQSRLVYIFTGIEYTDEMRASIGLRFVF